MTPDKVSPMLPVFVNVTTCAALVVPTSWLLKLRAAGVSVAVATPPVPLRFAVSVALPVGTMRDPLRRPPMDGVNVTCVVQLAPVAKTEEQLFVWLKSPVVETEPTVTQPWVAVTVNAWPRLEEPTGWMPKSKLDGVSVAAAGVVRMNS